LLADRHGRPSDLSRSHRITNPEPGWWDVAGGKLTTYRLIAEETVDQVSRTMGKSAHDNRCRTAIMPLLSPEEKNDFSGILPPEFTRAAVEHYCVNEWALHLDDVMIRRTGWHHYFPDAAQRAEQVADWMRELLGWPEEQVSMELRRYEALGDWRPRASEPVLAKA
jgi:glycerol-3-phosphate dehydrogenase